MESEEVVGWGEEGEVCLGVGVWGRLLVVGGWCVEEGGGLSFGWGGWVALLLLFFLVGGVRCVVSWSCSVFLFSWSGRLVGLASSAPVLVVLLGRFGLVRGGVGSSSLRCGAEPAPLGASGSEGG